ncbi:response regulator [Massilia sp. UMI-21]|nr:response regulator [Massilia sp. UMI-21]
MSKRILVVDDQADLRLLIRLSLRALGEVLQTASAEQALDMIADGAPDLLVLDVCLGRGRSGLDLCRTLRADPPTRGMKILLLSANGQPSDIAAGRAAGADDYVVKPFSPDALLDAAARLLTP